MFLGKVYGQKIVFLVVFACYYYKRQTLHFTLHQGTGSGQNTRQNETSVFHHKSSM